MDSYQIDAVSVPLPIRKVVTQVCTVNGNCLTVPQETHVFFDNLETGADSRFTKNQGGPNVRCALVGAQNRAKDRGGKGHESRGKSVRPGPRRRPCDSPNQLSRISRK